MVEVSQKKKIAMVIAFRDFRDEEYFIPKQILRGAGFEIDTVSDSSGIAIGKLGGEAKIDILLEDLELAEYAAILFIGGSGAVKYIDNDICHQIIKETIKQNKVLGAICIAPLILARAGALKGKRATVWSSSMDKSAVKDLEGSGAVFEKDSLVIDGKIITASGPIAAKDFANAVISLIK